MKSPNWATRMQRAVSGRELRVNDYILPIYTFTLTYEVLRDRWDIRDGPLRGHAYADVTTPRDELRQIWNFFNQQCGASIPFQFYDPTDNTTRADPAVAQAITVAVGDGTTKSFQLCSAIRAPIIPIDYTFSPTGSVPNFDTGVITYGTAPGSGTPITFDGTYRYKVRFATDNLEAENFMYQLWSMKQLKLTSVLY
jgi:hypothetical protein